MPKLLLADDSVTIQRVIELTFSGEDVQVIAVGDGDEAIARIPTERPDIVLADIGMPKRSGYDVAAFVKGNPSLAHIPVLLLAGAFEPVDQSRADQVRCDGVLVKPFEPQQVIARVRELVNGSRKAQDRAAMDARTAPPEPRAAAAEPRPPSAQPRVIDSRPVVEIPDARGTADAAPGADAGDSLDDYFDRLDAAFASLGGGGAAAGAPPAPSLDDLAEQVSVPTIDDLLGAVPAQIVPGDVPAPGIRISPPPVEPPDAMPTMSPASAPSPSPAPPAEDEPAPGSAASRNVIADVFSALLAAEQGDPDAAAHLASARPPHAVTDELVDAVTRRVLERLAPGAARDLVAQVVSEIAERLVREEIARIRGTS